MKTENYISNINQDMEATIQYLSNELNEVREVLRKKKNDLDEKYSDLNINENNPKSEFKQFMNKISDNGKDCYHEKSFLQNSIKMNSNSEEIEKGKPFNPKVNFDALKRLLIVVNKINKTYDPIRI